MTQMSPIDIVVPWVDGSDPEWRRLHDQYSVDKNSDDSSARYRDWDLFHFWFRAIEKNAPWVRTVHLVTFGHLPKWINLDNPKLHIVRHEDFIPEQYLPTFSSHVIELNLHRIPMLAEHFIYFNDDVYLSHVTNAEDFFQNGKPVDTAVFGVIKNNNVENFMPYIMLNMMALVNMNFDKRTVIKKNFKKWYTIKYGKQLVNNIYLSPWSEFTGFRNYHTATAFCKSTFEEVWQKCYPFLDETCMRKFRSRQDVNQYLFRYWQLCTGNFVPKKADSVYLTIGQQNAEVIKQKLADSRYKIVCINDDPLAFDFSFEQNNLENIFKQIFPDKSSFEK